MCLCGGICEEKQESMDKEEHIYMMKPNKESFQREKANEV